ncbi:hypothetical protein AB4304_13925 [Vibrio breoganii]
MKKLITVLLGSALLAGASTVQAMDTEEATFHLARGPICAKVASNLYNDDIALAIIDFDVDVILPHVAKEYGGTGFAYSIAPQEEAEMEDFSSRNGWEHASQKYHCKELLAEVEEYQRNKGQ